MSKAPPKIAREVAATEFARMCEAYRIEVDVERDDEETAEWDEISGAIIRDMMSGELVVDEQGLPTFTPPGGPAFKFHKATGATYTALETYPSAKQMQNMIAAVAELTRTDKPTLSKLEAPDFQALLRLAKLFLHNR